ncbi:hypothetical protein [Radiobacillus sp. PE A8.2]|uniref:hypothetical protein n=1 Tax=Radiobacillus sp. PE A8.2 TaxID=3380349 RepID=UPI003890BAF2
MKKTSFISGLVMIGLSGIIFTWERFLSLYLFGIIISDDKRGSYPSEPSMPNIFENIFVCLLLVIGIVLVLFSLSKFRKSA